MTPLTVGSCFAGIGGIDYGLELTGGFRTVWQIEIDEWCRRVLAKHWPDVRRHGDIREISGDELEPVDVLAGGFPCQPVSVAGLRRGQEDERWLWPELARLVRVLRPRWVLLENTPGLLSRGFGDVLGDLAACGYDAEWDCLPAAAVGAPHLRDRVWIVAYPHGGCMHWAGSDPGDGGALPPEEPQRLVRRGGRGTAVAGTDGEPLVRFAESRPQRAAWRDEPELDRVAHGIPRRVDRLRGLGNAVVPQVVAHIGRLILEAEAALEGA